MIGHATNYNDMEDFFNYLTSRLPAVSPMCIYKD